MFEQTQEDSLTDPLTGLPNRRSMFVHLSRELARAERLKSEVALIVMDIDGFKTINDTYGHNVGDHALREVAPALQGALRPYDLCVRYAGDEFIVVLADCSREAAELKRRELQDADRRDRARSARRQAAAARRQRRRRGVPARRRRPTKTLLADADHRMYRDKAARRGHLPSRRRRRPRIRASRHHAARASLPQRAVPHDGSAQRDSDLVHASDASDPLSRGYVSCSAANLEWHGEPMRQARSRRAAAGVHPAADRARQERVNVAVRGQPPEGSGPANRHGMPQLPVGQHEVKNWPVLDLGEQPGRAARRLAARGRRPRREPIHAHLGRSSSRCRRPRTSATSTA